MRMRLGVAGELVPRNPTDFTPALASSLRELGISTVALHLLGPPGAVDAQSAERVRATLHAQDIEIAQSTGYNPIFVHPDPAVRQEELARLGEAFSLARRVGAGAVLSGSSSLHPTRFYGPHPDNHLPETRDRLIESLREAASVAEQAGIPLVIETHVLTAMDSAESIGEVLDAVASPFVRINFDPVNLMADLPSVYDTGSAIRRTWASLRPYLHDIAHIKDVTVGEDTVLQILEVPPGEGRMDYEAFFEICHTMPEGAALIVEHLSAEDTIARLGHVRAQAERCGVSIH